MNKNILNTFVLTKGKCETNILEAEDLPIIIKSDNKLTPLIIKWNTNNGKYELTYELVDECGYFQIN